MPDDDAPDDVDPKTKHRRELLRKALAEMAPVEGEGRDILEKIGKFVKESGNGDADDESGLMAFANMAELILPGTLASWERLKKAALMIASREGLGALINDDPVIVPAVRILQALLIAVERGDDAALREWERKTLAYMMERAPDDYARLPIPPRVGIDRHIILGVVLRRIKELLQLVPAASGLMESTMFAMMVGGLVNAGFPNLREVEGMSVVATVAERYPKHVEKYGTPKDIDPDHALVGGRRVAVDGTKRDPFNSLIPVAERQLFADTLATNGPRLWNGSRFVPHRSARHLARRRGSRSKIGQLRPKRRREGLQETGGHGP